MALTFYERLLVGQPQVRVAGLWRVEGRYSIVCPDLHGGTNASTGQSLDQWLFARLGALRPPISLSATVPANAIRVDERPVDATAELRGVQRTLRDVVVDIGLAVGANFPAFRVTRSNGEIRLAFDRVLAPEELHILQTAVEALDQPIDFVAVLSDEPGVETFYREKDGDLVIRPSRALSSGAPRLVRQLIEDDEDFWTSNRNESLIGRGGLPAKSMVPKAWHASELRCVVDATAFPPSNIRTYLTLFDTVIVALPLSSYFDEALHAFGVTRAELVQLAATGRVRFLLPQSIERYDSDWIADALEADRDSFIGSRRLSCAVLSDTRTRMPFIWLS